MGEGKKSSVGKRLVTNIDVGGFSTGDFHQGSAWILQGLSGLQGRLISRINWARAGNRKEGYRGRGLARPRPPGRPQPGSVRPLPGTRQGRPRGTRSRPHTEKAPLGSRSRASPPSAATTVPCIHTVTSSRGSRPAAARDSRHAPGLPSVSRRSCSARTLNGGDRGSRTAAGPPPGAASPAPAAVAAAMLPRLRFPANFDRQRGPVRGHQSGALWRNGAMVGVGGRGFPVQRLRPASRSAHAYVKQLIVPKQ